MKTIERLNTLTGELEKQIVLKGSLTGDYQRNAEGEPVIVEKSNGRFAHALVVKFDDNQGNFSNRMSSGLLTADDEKIDIEELKGKSVNVIITMNNDKVYSNIQLLDRYIGIDEFTSEVSKLLQNEVNKF